MNWKLYGWDPSNEKYGKFYYSDFSYFPRLSYYVGYDFFYMENYHFQESLTGCCYEMWDCILKPGDVVVDLGANVGFFTRRAAEIGSRVIAVEGSPEVFSCLVENTHDLSNVSCLNAIVVGNEADPEGKICYTSQPALRVTLAQIMQMYGLDRIDFLKCDIEGGEWRLLGDISSDTLSRIDRVSMEAHGELPEYDIQSLYIPNKIRHSHVCNNTTNFYYVNNISSD